MLFPFHNIASMYSMDPWENFSGGISNDSGLYGVAGSLYRLIETVALIGVVVGIFLAIILMLFSKKWMEEGKKRIVFLLTIVLGISILPGAITLVSQIVSAVLWR